MCEENTASLDTPISWNDLVAPSPFSLNTLNWGRLASHEEFLPQYRDKARHYIKTLLGYLPSSSLIAPYDSFLRSLAYEKEHERIDPSIHLDQVMDIVRDIRNQDMLPHDSIEHSAIWYKEYEYSQKTFTGPFVRDRLINLLGDIPDLKYSLTAELLMQCEVDDGRIEFGDFPNEIDIKAMTIVRYRWALLNEGKYAANKTPLWYYDFAESNGYFDDDAFAAKIPTVNRFN